MGRRLAREYTMKLLYQMEMQKEELNEGFVEDFIQEHVAEKCDNEYIKEVSLGVWENIEKIDSLINTYSSGWNVTRMSKVDLSVLRLSIFELMFKKDIPSGVAINEAVELSKNYSSDDAPAFVNSLVNSIDFSNPNRDG